MVSRRELSVMLMLMLAFLVLPAFSENPEKIYSPVTDYSGALSQSERANLSSLISSIEREKNVQIAVYIEPKIPLGTTLEERSLLIAETNGIGAEDSDNGLLLYVALDDGLYRWEAGYGLEGEFSSSYLGRVSRETIAPNFRQGRYYAGISLALEALFGKAPLGNGKQSSDIGPITELFLWPVLALIALVFFLFVASILLSWHFSSLMLLSVSRRLLSREKIERAEIVYLFQSIVFAIGLLAPVAVAGREFLAGYVIVLSALLFSVSILPALVRVFIMALISKKGFSDSIEAEYRRDVSRGASGKRFFAKT